MVRCRDSFLHFISDNLPDGAVLHAIRRDPNVRDADTLATNAVNVSFYNLSAGAGTALCSQQAVIDVINDDENTAVDWVGALVDVLRASFYTPLQDYADSANTVSTGTNITWDRKRVTFKHIAASTYSHFSCLLSLKFISRG